MRSRFARLAAYIGHARARSLLVACGLLVGVLLAGAATWLILEMRAHDLLNTERELNNTSLILAQEMERSLQNVDLLQLSLIEHMRQSGINNAEAFERQMNSFEVHQDLARRTAGLSQMAALSLYDRNGNLINFSRSWPAPSIDARNRPYITALLNTNASTMFISEALRSKTTGKWTIYLSRRFQSRDGDLIGIVLSTIEVDYFERIFSDVKMDGDAAFQLYRADGLLLIRYPHVDDKIGKTFRNTENFQRLLGSLGHGVTRLISQMDGKERLVAGRAVEQYPVIISVSNAVDAVLASWRREARIFGGATMLLELVIAATILLAIRNLRGYELLHAAEAAQARAEVELAVARERERSSGELQTQWAHFDMALSNMHQGLCMYDHENRLLVANRRFTELFGLPADAVVPGMTYTEIFDRILAEGGINPDDLVNIRARRQELISRGDWTTFNWELASGTIIAVIYQPMDDGWLATYDDITERRRAEARMAYMARHDSLTDLPNRALLREQLEHGLVFARRGHALALLCLDLDQFKAVNDTLGHSVGDLVLKAVAGRLDDHTRDTDTVARLGGDEFAIIQTGISKPTDATTFASRLIELLHTPVEIEGHQIVIGTSIGIAYAPQDGLDADTLLRSADLALYRAKADGRGIYRLFHAEMDAQMQARRLLELDLRKATHSRQLEVFYQPLINLHGKTIAGFEALLRWRHPQRGIVSPAEFVPIAEETGLIISIGEFVLQQACKDAASWPGGLKVAVNLSPAQFKSHNLVNAVIVALKLSGLPPTNLELEITETVVLQDTDATMATLHELHKLGVSIAMDDFGTGYSSLSHLRLFPFDRIKIDQSFVRELGKRLDCSAIVRAVTALSEELGMATTAEGVETQEQLDTLLAMGCTDVQGYLFSPAVPGIEVRGLLSHMAAIVDVNGTKAQVELITPVAA